MSFIDGGAPRAEADFKLISSKGFEWLQSFNIGDMMSLKPLSYDELTKTQTMLAEISTESMVDKASTRQSLLMIVSYFCIATELRFKFSQDKHVMKLKEGQAWHLQSLEIAKDLLPKDCALWGHLKESYKRNYLDIFEAVRPKQLKKKAKEKAKEKAKAMRVDISMAMSRKN